MRFIRPLLPFVTLLLASSPGFAAPETQSSSRAPHQQASDAATEQQVLPDLDAESLPLGDFLSILRERVPGFQAVVASESIRDFTLPQLHLKKVTVGQILTLIQDLNPELQVIPVSSSGSAPVYLFTSQRSQSMPGTRVMAYGLGKLIDRLASRDTAPGKNAAAPDQAAREKALNEILTLVKATLAEANGSVSPVLQVHEGTQTILVKGTQEQTDAVGAALQTLEKTLAPNMAEEINTALAKAEQDHQLESARQQADINRLRDELQAADRRIESLHQEVLQREEEAARLKVKLEALEAKGKAQQ